MCFSKVAHSSIPVMPHTKSNNKKSKVQVESNPKSRGEFFLKVGNEFWQRNFSDLWEVKKAQKEKTGFS
jgi:hypothetical protein